MYNDLQHWIEVHSKEVTDEEETSVVVTQLNEDEVSVKCNLSLSGKVTNLIEINHSEEEEEEEEGIGENKTDEETYVHFSVVINYYMNNYITYV